MNNFSKALKKHISDMDLKIQSLAKTSGVDRTLIQKMIKGERVPADKQIIENLIAAMMLTPRQEEELKKLYHIARIGEDVYSRHMLVKDLIESFGELPDSTNLNLKTEYAHNLDGLPEVATASGNYEVNTIIKAIIELEASKPNGIIKIVAQPGFEFLMGLLTIIGSTSPQLTIEHIFCIQKSVREDGENRYNLNCIKQIAPLLISGCKYSPYIYYDDVSVHINDTSIFPYMILTEDRVINISFDLSNATIFHVPNLLKMYTSVYNNIHSMSKPLITRLDNMMENFMYYMKMEQNSGLLAYDLMEQPCLTCFLTEEIAYKYVYNEIPGIDELIKVAMERANHYFDEIQDSHKMTAYFSKEGLDTFMQTGRIEEIAPNIYEPISKEDCNEMLKKLYDRYVNGLYNAVLYDSNKLKFQHNLALSSLDSKTIGFVYTNPNSESIYFSINEQSLANAIHSFLAYLEESDMVYTKEETKAFIKSRIES